MLNGLSCVEYSPREGGGEVDWRSIRKGDVIKEKAPFNASKETS